MSVAAALPRPTAGTENLSATSRRLTAALLISAALHAFVLANVKPVSAEYSRPELLYAQLVLSPPVQTAAPAHGTPSRLDAGPDEQAPAEPGREIGADTTVANDPRLAKKFMEQPDSRPGAAPDDREALLEMNLPVPREYYSALEVDRRAAPIDDVPLSFPRVSLGPGKTAKVILLLLINESGGVDNAAVLQASPPGLFEKSARDAFASARFTPALKNGLPVKSQKIIEVTYDPS